MIRRKTELPLSKQSVEQLNLKFAPKVLLGVVSSLYDGYPQAALYLAKIRAFYCKKAKFDREHLVYAWLYRSNLKGKRLVEFFENEGNFLTGLNKIVNRIEGRKYSLETIKYDECL